MTTITPNLSLTEPDFAATNWNTPLNANFSILDSIAGNSVSISLTGASSPQTFIAAQYQVSAIDLTGVLTGNFTYNLPSTVGGKWFIRNLTTGPYTVAIGSNSQTVNIPADGLPYLVFVDLLQTSQYIYIQATNSIQVYAGNPNGNVPGNAGTAGVNPASMIWDNVSKTAWVCTTSGIASIAVWLPVSGGIFQYVVSVPAALTGSQNDYAPTGLATSGLIQLSSNAAYNITGLTAQTSNHRVVFENVGNFNLTFVDSSASSAAANRFLLGANYVIQPGQSVVFWYDLTNTKWRQEGTNYYANALPAQVLTWTSPSAITFDPWNGANASLVLSGASATFGPITNQALRVGQTGFFDITEDATGGRLLAFDATITGNNGYAPGINTTANARTRYSYIINAASGVGSVIFTPVSWGLGPHVIIEDQQPSGTAGPSLTSGSFATVRLTALASNAFSLATLAANQFVLQAGTYYIGFSMPMENTAKAQCLIYNVTDAANAIIGRGVNQGAVGVYSIDLSTFGSGIITITSAKTFELRGRVSNTNVIANAMGFGVTEIYSRVEITKLA